MTRFYSEVSATLQKINRQGLTRSRKQLDSPQGVNVTIDGDPFLNFCSNDYLGLANHPQVVQAFKNAVDDYGVGSGAAHLICGHSQVHHALEEELADFTGRDRALLFSTGYMANMGVIAALTGKGDAVFEDRMNHASLLDGGLLSGARFKRFPHNDIRALRSAIQTSQAHHKLVVTDAVFSMDGDLALLPELAAVSTEHNALLLVDDAHGMGVLGELGEGSCAHFRLDQQQVPLLMGTLGKAFGTFGAFVAGPEALIELLLQKARTYIYTTAMPPAIAAATRASLALIRSESWRRERLQMLVQRFRLGAQQLGLELMDSFTPIQPLLIGASEQAMYVNQQLMKQGIWIGAIRPPTVAAGSARIRITFSAEHQPQQVDQLLDALSAIKL